MTGPFQNPESCHTSESCHILTITRRRVLAMQLDMDDCMFTRLTEIR